MQYHIGEMAILYLDRTAIISERYLDFKSIPEDKFLTMSKREWYETNGDKFDYDSFFEPWYRLLGRLNNRPTFFLIPERGVKISPEDAAMVDYINSWDTIGTVTYEVSYYSDPFYSFSISTHKYDRTIPHSEIDYSDAYSAIELVNFLKNKLQNFKTGLGSVRLDLTEYINTAEIQLKSPQVSEVFLQNYPKTHDKPINDEIEILFEKLVGKYFIYEDRVFRIEPGRKYDDWYIPIVHPTGKTEYQYRLWN